MIADARAKPPVQHAAAPLELGCSVRGGCRRRREAAVTLRKRGVAHAGEHDVALGDPGSRRVVAVSQAISQGRI
jgi:hypothetical protein